MWQAAKFDPKQKLSQWGLRDAVRDVGGDFNVDSAAFLRERVVTAAPISAPGKVQPIAGVSNFTLQRQFSNGQKAVALNLQERGAQGHVVRAYWVKQGGFADIPVHPKGDGLTVFTPDFSGCSLYVDQIDASMYRVYHAEGGKEQAQYHTQHHHLGVAAQWTAKDYAKEGSPRAFALMRYRDGQWFIQFQKQTGVRGIGLREGKLLIAERQGLDGDGEIPVADLISKR